MKNGPTTALYKKKQTKKKNTFRNLSLPYSTEIGILIDLLHLRSQRQPSELSFFFAFFIVVVFLSKVRLNATTGTTVP